MRTLFTSETEAGRLALARRAAGYRSAAAAARRLGVPEITFRSHENGLRSYDLETAIAYAKLFNTQASYLKTGKGEPSKADDLRVSRSSMLAMLAEGVRISRMTGLDPEFLADMILEALVAFATETDVVDPGQYARIRLGSLAKRSGPQ